MNFKRKYRESITNTANLRKKRQVSDSDYGDDSDTDNQQMLFPPELLQHLMAHPREHKTHRDRIFRDGNHIYFRGGVTMQSIEQLCGLIDDVNNHYKECCDHELGYIIPKPIYVHICTMGGDINAGFMAYDYIKNSNIPVYTVSEGRTISAGTIMFMAGKKRFMAPTSYMLIHQIRTHVSGTVSKLEEEYETCLNMMSKMKNIYMSNLNTKIPNKKDLLNDDDLVEQLEKDQYWDYATCYKKGLIHAPYTNTQDRDREDKLDTVKNMKECVKYLN